MALRKVSFDIFQTACRLIAAGHLKSAHRSCKVLSLVAEVREARPRGVFLRLRARVEKEIDLEFELAQRGIWVSCRSLPPFERPRPAHMADLAPSTFWNLIIASSAIPRFENPPAVTS